MNDADREELMARRIAEKVAEDTDKLIKRKYFWIATLFAGISWFGGAALITSIVQLRVIEKMEPHLQDLARAKATTDLMSEKLKEANKTIQAVEEKIDATTKREATLDASVREIDEKLKTREATLDASVREIDEKLRTGQARLTELSTSGALAIQQLNDRFKGVGAAVSEIFVANQKPDAGNLHVRIAKTEAISRLDKPQIVLRLVGDVPPQLESELTEKLSDYLVTSEGPFRLTVHVPDRREKAVGHAGEAVSLMLYEKFYESDAAMAKQIARKTESSLRYFYESDAAMAQQIARKTEDALKQVGIDNKPIPTLNFTGQSIRPPEGSFELWINLSKGQLL
jgi:hypothetical protein